MSWVVGYRGSIPCGDIISAGGMVGNVTDLVVGVSNCRIN